MTRTIFSNGDSWTFGSEMAAPEFLAPHGKGVGMGNRFTHDGADYLPSNDFYRIPRVWPSRLGDMLGDAEVINNAWPARSNDTIYRSTMEWLLTNYITPGKDTSDLTVIIGWSSLERKNIIFEDFEGKLFEYTIWPAMNQTHYYDLPMVKKYFQMHVTHLWTQRECLTRFVEQNLSLHLLCKAHGIKHHFFNCFYIPRGEGGNFHKWKDLNIESAIRQLYDHRTNGWLEPNYNDRQEVGRLLQMWDSIPEEVFLNKSTGATFKTYVEQNLPEELRWCGIHPSPEGHDIWAQHLRERLFNG
jgi:hypothetical protein